MAWVRTSIGELAEVERCDVILAQLGADSHIRDPLGGYLDDEGMRRRDAMVFETCRALEMPLAWNLAGGYQEDAGGSIEPVLRLHDASARECSRVYDA